jgi:hypothetical protein
VNSIFRISIRIIRKPDCHRISESLLCNLFLSLKIGIQARIKLFSRKNKVWLWSITTEIQLVAHNIELVAICRFGATCDNCLSKEISRHSFCNWFQYKLLRINHGDHISEDVLHKIANIHSSVHSACTKIRTWRHSLMEVEATCFLPIHRKIRWRRDESSEINTIPYYHSKELSRVNMLQEHEEGFSRPRNSQNFFQFILCILWLLIIIVCGYMICSIGKKR